MCIRDRVSPALAHTERYILGKRTKEDFRNQEHDTTIDRIVTGPPHEVGDTDHQMNTQTSPGQEAQATPEDSNLHATPELNDNPSFTEENKSSNNSGKIHSNTVHNTSETKHVTNGTEPPASEQHGGIRPTGEGILEHDSVSGSSEKPTLEKNEKEETNTTTFGNENNGCLLYTSRCV